MIAEHLDRVSEKHDLAVDQQSDEHARFLLTYPLLQHEQFDKHQCPMPELVYQVT